MDRYRSQHDEAMQDSGSGQPLPPSDGLGSSEQDMIRGSSAQDSSTGEHGIKRKRVESRMGERIVPATHRPPPGHDRLEYPRTMTDLVVSNIPITTRVNRIVEHFSCYGEITNVMTRLSTKNAAMQALIRFKDPAAVQRVKRKQAVHSPSADRREATAPRVDLRRDKILRHGESNYRTPPTSHDSVSVKLSRSSSFDQKKEVSKLLCDLAAGMPSEAYAFAPEL